MNYQIISTDWKTNQPSLMNIRDLVFLQEQHVPVDDEWDDRDETAIHFLVRTNNAEAIGCARLLVETHNNQNVFHIGRVAVLKNYRNQGIGHQLMQAILTYCQQQNPAQDIYLDAQTTRQPFYEHLHFVARGAIFMDANIPHIEMWYQA